MIESPVLGARHLFLKTREDKHLVWGGRIVDTCSETWQVIQKLSPRRVLLRTVGRGEGNRIILEGANLQLP